MDFEHDERERARACEFGESVIAGSLVARDRAGRWDGELVRAMGAADLLGSDASAVVLSQRLIGFAKGSGDAGLALAWACHAIGCAAIERVGSLVQRHRYLPALARGEWLGGLALAEHERVRAHPSTSGWRLEGSKTRVVNAPVADVFVVSARGDSPDDTAIFVIDRGSPGLHVGPRIETSGLRTATIAALHFDGCELPGECRLGDADTFGLLARWQRACLLAPWVGLLDALIEACVVKAREQGTQPSRALLADLRIRGELCRRVQARAAWRLDHGGPELDRELAVANAMLGESIAAMTHAAANGFAEPLGSAGPIERLARDASTSTRLLDPPERERAAVADLLLGFTDDPQDRP